MRLSAPLPASAPATPAAPILAVDVHGAAAALNCSANTIRRLIKSGELPSFLLGTARGARTSLRALWRRARIYEPLLEPATGLIAVPKWRDVPPEGDCWSPAEVGRLLAEAGRLVGNFKGKKLSRAAYWRAYILTAYETGLRHSNIMRITAAGLSQEGKLATQNQSGKAVVVSISEAARRAILATNPETRPTVFGVLENRYFFLALKGLIQSAGLTGGGEFLRRAGAAAQKVSPELFAEPLPTPEPKPEPPAAPVVVSKPAFLSLRPRFEVVEPLEPEPCAGRPRIVPKWREAKPEPGQTQSLYEYFKTTFRPRKLLGKSPRTSEMYLQTLDRFGDFLQRVPTLGDLTEDAVCGFLEWRLSNGIGHHTADKEGDKIKALANYAARKRHIAEFLDIPQINPAEILPTCWRREQVEQLFRACREAQGRFGNAPRNVWWLAFHAVCLATGERTEAMLSLRWDMLQGSTLSVPANIRKGKRKAARYRLPPSVLEELEQLRPYTEGKIFAAPWKDVSASFYGHYTALLKSAGLPSSRRFKPQCLRRTFASFLEAGGGDATEALGHSDRSVTKESYLDTSITLAGKESAASIVWRELGLSSRPLAITHDQAS